MEAQDSDNHRKSVDSKSGGISLGSLFKDKRRNSAVNRKNVTRLVKSFAILFPLFVGQKFITSWLILLTENPELEWYKGQNLFFNLRLLLEIPCTHLQGFVVSILYCFGCNDVQQEIKFQYRTRFKRTSDKRKFSRGYNKRGSTATQGTILSRCASEQELERFQLHPIRQQSAPPPSL